MDDAIKRLIKGMLSLFVGPLREILSDESPKRGKMDYLQLVGLLLALLALYLGAISTQELPEYIKILF